ncbi:MAG: zf-HC2 domain-containing protein [Oscillospiraceae bacterium]|nr:zf-HC2 domain-containing protein [Oscillospiraceae bacterium]
MQLFHDGHLTQKALGAFSGGALTDAELADVAQHIADCPDCLARAADAAQQSCAPPRGFAQNVRYAVAARARAKRREMVHYSAAVAACVAVCVGIALAGFPSMPDIFRPQETIPAPAPSALTAPSGKEDFWTKFNEAIAKTKSITSNREEPTDDKTAQ